MKRLLFGLLATGSLASAAVVTFDLGPNGMNSSNEVPTIPTPSTGTGGAIETGIWFDTSTSNLTFVIGYGSAAGFQDLTGPATATHIHGPADLTNPAPVLISLVPQLFPNNNPALGGIIRGMAQYTTPAMVDDLLHGKHYINVHTAANPAGEIRGQLLPRTNQPPTVTCPAPVEAECTVGGSDVRLTVQVADPEGDPLTVVWSVGGKPVETNSVPAGTPGVPVDVPFTTAYPLGTNAVDVSVSDGTLDAACSTTVTVVDTTSPIITSLVAGPSTLWPPNHKFVPVRIKIKTEDCSPVKSKIVSVTSNEPVDGLGDGRTQPDWVITGDLTLKLRAERSGKGSGRVYTITVEASDGINPPTQGTVEVKVPHDAGHR